jgi:methyl-accepting chemotaxis protein PixJ
VIKLTVDVRFNKPKTNAILDKILVASGNLENSSQKLWGSGFSAAAFQVLNIARFPVTDLKTNANGKLNGRVQTTATVAEGQPKKAPVILRQTVDPQPPEPNESPRSLLPHMSLRLRATLFALSMSTLPILTLGGITYYLTDQVISQQAKPANGRNSPELVALTDLLEQQIRMVILVGTGVTAIVATLHAIFVANRAVRPVLKASKSMMKTAEHLRREGFDDIPEPELEDELVSLEVESSAIAKMLPDILQRRRVEAELTQLLTEITLRVRDCSSQKEILELACVEGARAIKVDRVLVYRFNSDGSGTVIAEHAKAGAPKIRGVSILDPCFRMRHVELYKAGRVRAINDVANANLAECYHEMLQRFKVKANLVTPVILHGELLGLLIAHQCSKPKDWQPSEIEFFSRLAMQVGYALEREDLEEPQQAAAAMELIFSQVTRQLRSQLSQQSVLDTAVTEIRRAFQCDRALIYRFNPDWSGTVVAESVTANAPKALGAQIMDPCFRERHIEQYQNGRVRAINNIFQSNLTDCHIESLSRFSVRANLVAPVIRDGKLIALVIMHQCNDARDWKPAEIDIFSKIATQIGFALEHASLVEKVEQARRELEEEMRPRSRALAGTTMGICIADATRADYPLTYCNSAFEKMTGYSYAEAIGRNCRFMQGPDTDQNAIAQIRLALREKRDCHVILKNYRKDGTPFWNELSISPVRDDAGQVTHFVAWQTDVTKQHDIVEQVQAATETLAKSTGELETAIRVIAATAKVEGVEQALVTIRRSADSIQTLAAGMRHARVQMRQVQDSIARETTTLKTAETGLSELLRSVPPTTDKIQTVAKTAQQVFEIIGKVNHAIAETSLLAMNAVFQAGQARTSEENHELLQVTEAVQTLAEQSALSTQEVERLVDSIQSSTHAVVSGIQQQEAKLTTGTRLVARSHQALFTAVTQGTETVALVEEAVQVAEQVQADLTTADQRLQQVSTSVHRTSEQAAIAAVSLQYLLDVSQKVRSQAQRFEAVRS